MRPSRLIVTVIATACLLLASCGSDDKDKGSAGDTSATSTTDAKAVTTAAGGTKGDAVKIADFSFAPSPLEASAGTTVTFTNSDPNAHTATADNGSAQPFDTGDLKTGESKQVTFAKPGTYSYHCDIHNYMKGKIEVR